MGDIGQVKMTSTPEPKRIFGLSYVEMGILVVLLCIGCVFVAIILTKVFAPTEISLPPHTVNDYWDNGKGTNFAYFIVADKSLTEEQAKAIISSYEDKHRGYTIINIFIFCDATYAKYKYLNDLSVTDNQFFSHVLYWYMAGTATNVGMSLQSKPDNSLPTFRSACK